MTSSSLPNISADFNYHKGYHTIINTQNINFQLKEMDQPSLHICYDAGTLKWIYALMDLPMYAHTNQHKQDLPKYGTLA